jgi:hypothetical protein
MMVAILLLLEVKEELPEEFYILSLDGLEK